MANLAATLYITIKTKAGKWTTVKPAMPDNGRLKKLVAVVEGKEEKHSEGQYKVRWLENGQPRFDSVGNDPDAALMAPNRREKALAANAAGVEVKRSDGKRRYRISDALADMSRITRLLLLDGSMYVADFGGATLDQNLTKTWYWLF